MDKSTAALPPDVARALLAKALRNGWLVREPCEVCGAERVDAHHYDYSKPLDVRWLCKEHHVEAHRDQARKYGAESFGGAFVQRLRRARLELGLTQQEFAHELGMSVRAVQSWESEGRTPRPKQMRRISELTGRPISWFFEEAA